MTSPLDLTDLKTSLAAITDLVLPRVCVVCGAALMPCERHICIGCLADFPETRFATYSHNAMSDRFNARLALEGYEPYAYATALYHYRAEAGYKGISQALKYHRDFGAGRFFARLLGERLSGSELFADVDLVVPVPLHWTRRLSRGYNQAEVIARVVAQMLGAEYGPGLLRRRRRTQSQTRLRGAAKAANVAAAFAPARSPLRRKFRGTLPSPRHILLIDDVFTSGSTLAECYKALRLLYGSPTRISVATLAFAGDN